LLAFIPLYLSLWVFGALQTTLPVFDRDVCPKNLQGYAGDESITICVNELKIPREEVINHEAIHLVHKNFGVDTLLPPSVIHYLAQNTMTEAQVLSILVNYSHTDYLDGEFEARLLQKLPSPAIITLYRLSEDYATLTSRNKLPIHLQPGR
jgi:hypothetical protein